MLVEYRVPPDTDPAREKLDVPRKVVPELIQNEMTAERIVAESRTILADAKLRERTILKLTEVRKKLGAPGAAGRVADIALAMMT